MAPIRYIVDGDQQAVLAFITATTGPSYRRVGSMMAIDEHGETIGSLSSGCIEADIVTNALWSIDKVKPLELRYGAGSPFKDIVLPCGGGVSVMLVPNPDKTVLSQVLNLHRRRKSVSLSINVETGEISTQSVVDQYRKQRFSVTFQPEIQFLVFGNGQETIAFSGLARAMGFDATIYSSQAGVFDELQNIGCKTQTLKTPDLAPVIEADDRTAIVLFFHDHEWEPQILRTALKTDAFYIGSQGGQKAVVMRYEALRNLKVAPTDFSRLHGPIGSIKSARDPKTLAVSVLSEVLGIAQAKTEIKSRHMGISLH